MSGNRSPKVYYATQTGVHPPTVVLFTNGPDLFDDSYVRYLTKALRDAFPFSEVAVKLLLRARGEGKSREPDTDVLEPLASEESVDELPIQRARQPRPQPEPLEEDERDQRPRKKPRGSETWDF
jgi:GTP-binding protein